MGLLKRIREYWPLGLLIGLVGMALCAAGAALLPLLFPGAYAAMKIALQWVGLPLLGALWAFLPARGGLSHYLAWIAPPVIAACVPWAIVGFPLPPGVMLLCAFTAMIGASAGSVRRERDK